MNTIISPKAIFFQEDSKIPNNPHLPVLIYKAVLERQTADKDKIFQKTFDENGWVGMWKGVIYDYHHFHSNAHEVLAIATGHVSVMLGGESGKSFDLEGGDIIVLPAGTGHKMLSCSENLVVVGANPAGQKNYDICRSLQECPQAKERISKLALPSADPFYGAVGPLKSLWNNK